MATSLFQSRRKQSVNRIRRLSVSLSKKGIVDPTTLDITGAPLSAADEQELADLEAELVTLEADLEDEDEQSRAVAQTAERSERGLTWVPINLLGSKSASCSYLLAIAMVAI